jgi:hypothetical protein
MKTKRFLAIVCVALLCLAGTPVWADSGADDEGIWQNVVSWIVSAAESLLPTIDSAENPTSQSQESGSVEFYPNVDPLG